MITIVDYGHGNLYSIGQALRHLGASYEISDKPESIAKADKIIVPGVGAFLAAMDALKARGLVMPLREAAANGKLFLGICLGMQLLADRSEEFGSHEGLGLIPGDVIGLPDGNKRPDADRVPNVGWRTIHYTANEEAANPRDPEMVYFVHSLHFVAADPKSILATTQFNNAEIAAAIQRDNVIGYQFHPENSGPAGIDLLRGFVRL